MESCVVSVWRGIGSECEFLSFVRTSESDFEFLFELKVRVVFYVRFQRGSVLVLFKNS